MYLVVLIGRAWQGGIHDGDRYFAGGRNNVDVVNNLEQQQSGRKKWPFLHARFP
jgi:hypothetical protein